MTSTDFVEEPVNSELTHKQKNVVFLIFLGITVGINYYVYTGLNSGIGLSRKASASEINNSKKI